MKTIFHLSLIIILSSCSTIHQNYNQKLYMAEHTGKQYAYFHKPTNNEKTVLTSVSLSGFGTDHFYANEASSFTEASFKATHSEDGKQYSISAYFSKGSRKTIDYISDDNSFSENHKFENFGLRFDHSNFFRNDRLIFSPISIQFVYNYETGSYFDWRSELEGCTYNEILQDPDDEGYFPFDYCRRNYNKSRHTFALFGSPEIRYVINETFQVGLFGGVGFQFGLSKAAWTPFFGVQSKFGPVGVSFTRSRNSFSTFKDESQIDEYHYEKYQNRFEVSYYF